MVGGRRQEGFGGVGGEGVQHEEGRRGLRNRGDEDPICSLRSLSEGSAEEH